MKKSCKYCGMVHFISAVCQRKPPPKPARKKDTRESRFRSTAAWQKKTAEILERDHYLCKHCVSNGRISFGKLEVHHIVPLSERYDLRLDSDNLISLCLACHDKADHGGIPPATLVELARKKVPPLLFEAQKRQKT